MKLSTASFKTVLFWGSAALLLLHLAAALTAWPGLWGVDSWAYFSPVTAVILTLSGLLAIFPPVADRLAGLLFPERGPLRGFFQGRRVWLAASAVSLAAGVVFWWLRCRVHLLGDGYWWIRNLQGLKSWKNEPLALYLDWLVSRLPAVLPLELSAERAFQVVSLASGVIFVCALFLLARGIGQRTSESVLIFAGLITLGGMQLFAGYVETYPPQVAGVTIFLYLAWRMLSGRGRLFWAAAVFWICVLLHLSSLFLLPSLIYLYYGWWRRDRGRKRLLRLLLQLAGPAAAVALLMLAIRLDLTVLQDHGADNSHLLLPLLNRGSRYFSYSFFSPAHLADLLNLVLLISPFALALPLLLSGRMKSLSSLQRFLLAASVFPLAFLLVFNPELGFPRDWDIFVFAFIAPTLLGLTLVIEAGRASEGLVRYAALALLVPGAFHTLPWIMVNASSARALARYERLLEGGALRSVHARSFAGEEAAVYFRENKQLERSAGYYHRALEADSTAYRLWGSLAGVLETQGRAAEAETAFRRALSIESGSLSLIFYYAIFLDRQERLAEAAEYFRRAVEIEPRHAPAHWNLAVLYFKNGEYEKSKDEFQRVLELEPDSREAKENLEKLTQFLSGAN